MKGHQKENDRLMQEIAELKSIQRKNLMEIDYLKAQLANVNFELQNYQKINKYYLKFILNRLKNRIIYCFFSE